MNISGLWQSYLGQKNILNCFSGTAASVLKAPHYFFYCFLKKKKEKKTLFQFLNIIIGNAYMVSLGMAGNVG